MINQTAFFSTLSLGKHSVKTPAKERLGRDDWEASSKLPQPSCGERAVPAGPTLDLSLVSNVWVGIIAKVRNNNPFDARMSTRIVRSQVSVSNLKITVFVSQNWEIYLFFCSQYPNKIIVKEIKISINWVLFSLTLPGLNDRWVFSCVERKTFFQLNHKLEHKTRISLPGGFFFKLDII